MARIQFWIVWCSAKVGRWVCITSKNWLEISPKVDPTWPSPTAAEVEKLGLILQTHSSRPVQREAPISSYADISTDPDTQAQLKAIYGPDGIDEVDLFVGSLAEDHLPKAGCGKTFAALFEKQLDQIRYNDHGWFERRSGSTQDPEIVRYLWDVRKRSMAEIILQSTDLDCIPKHAMYVVTSERNK